MMNVCVAVGLPGAGAALGAHSAGAIYGTLLVSLAINRKTDLLELQLMSETLT